MTDIAWRYVGKDGQYHTGIPMRDLTVDEVAALTDEQRALVEASALYAPEAVMHRAEQRASRKAAAESEAR